MGLWRAPDHWCDGHGPRPLVMVTTSYPTAHNPLAGIFVQTLARSLRRAGHEVTVVAPAGVGAAPGSWCEEGIRGIFVPFVGWRKGPFHRAGLPELLLRHRLRVAGAVGAALGPLFGHVHRVVRRYGARTVVVGHWLVPGGFLAQFVGRLTGCTATTICHSSAVRMVCALPSGRFRRALVQFALGEGLFVSTCGELVELLGEVLGQKEVGERAWIAPMPAPEAKRCGAPPEGPPWRVMTLGRHVPIKGLDGLLRAWGAFGPEELVLWVCGEGPQRQELENIAQQQELHAVFPGIVLGAQKAAYFSGCHGFVLPSITMAGGRAEGAPVSVVEAMSYHLPILATCTGGIGEILESYESKILVEPTAEALRSAWPDFCALMQAHWSLSGEKS